MIKHRIISPDGTIAGYERIENGRAEHTDISGDINIVEH